MATAAILKKNQPFTAQLHMAYDIPTTQTLFGRHIVFAPFLIASP
jgi:hypothetical protein